MAGFCIKTSISHHIQASQQKTAALALIVNEILKIQQIHQRHLAKHSTKSSMTTSPQLFLALFAACLPLLASTAHAADITPGLWAISMETRTQAAPGFQPAPFTVNQCFTAADARDPSRLLGGLSNTGASDCQYTEKSYSGNTFKFAMQCGGAYALQSRGEVTFDAQTMNGVITAKANVAGTATEFQNKLSAKRIGNC